MRGDSLSASFLRKHFLWQKDQGRFPWSNLPPGKRSCGGKVERGRVLEQIRLLERVSSLEDQSEVIKDNFSV